MNTLHTHIPIAFQVVGIEKSDTLSWDYSLNPAGTSTVSVTEHDGYQIFQSTEQGNDDNNPSATTGLTEAELGRTVTITFTQRWISALHL